jgi:glycosyltransferase involved in cell wall biosynthesis
MAQPRLAVVVKGYPRLSETFIAQEILGLERRGLPLLIVSLRRPTDPAVHDLHEAIAADVLYLPEYLHDDPGRVLRSWRRVRDRAGYRTARAAWLWDLRRDPTRNRIRRFGQACVLAAELPRSIELIYVHYLHTPASVARYGAAMLGLPYAISAHAKDIWTTPAWEKQEKIRDARFLTTCTMAGADHLRALAPDADVRLIRHGLEPARFAAPARGAGPDGSDPEHPVRLLGVARLVPKKGTDLLLEALARLPAGLHWRYDHIGGGELRGRLEVQARQLGIADRVDWRGPCPADRVLEAYRAADLFVLPSRIAADGDRDGLPNVILEAAAQELAVVASEAGAIPEFVEPGVTGRLVPPEDPAALATALEALIRSPAERLRLGQAARARVLSDFTAEPGLDRIAARLRAELAAPARRAAA